MMVTTERTELRQELLACERAYLAAVQSGDGEAAARLTAPRSLVVSGRGPMAVDAPTIRRIVAGHDASRRYEIDEERATVVELDAGAAIIAYRLTTFAGDGTSTEAYDTDVWIRDEGRWKCALHVEVPATTS